MAEANIESRVRDLELNMKELTGDIKRVKNDLYGSDDDAGLTREFAAKKTEEMTLQKVQHKQNRRMMMLVALVPVAIKLMEVFHLLPK